MEAVLIVAHGSRAREAEKTLEAVVAMVREEIPHRLIETAYLSTGGRSIAEGLDSLLSKGAREIKLIPYFLFEGIHIRETIAKELAAYREKHMDIRLSLGKTLGADKRLAEILIDRIDS